ncbi:MAG TPA: NAD(P)/FAD-dependent oxidoreductase [Acidimicrobiales bacterium]|nr:NAD(P)/FAD-dependent oxidoreductase [Acidimicrobiales bacterium]
MTARRPLDCDVVVAGGGPAGASAAAHLAAAGLAVVVLDRQAFPRDKACGDFVGPSALAELDRLGVTGRPEVAAANKVRRAALHLDGRRLIIRRLPRVGDLPGYGRTIPRRRLDALVLGAARERGAAVVERARVTGFVARRGGVDVAFDGPGGARSLRAAVLVGADGASSAVARTLRGTPPPHEDRIMAVRAYVDGVAGPADRADLYFPGDSFPGYYWLFPTGGGQANVGVGMLLDTVPPPREGLRALLARLVADDPALAARLPGRRLAGRVVGWPLTTYNPRAPLVDDRLVLVGDAAGLINPLNGEGIQYALLSGRLAAEAIAAALASADGPTAAALAPYQAAVEAELRLDMALAGTVVQLIRNRALTPVWLETLRTIAARAKRDPGYADVVGGILAGLLPASRALRPDVLAATADGALASLAATGARTGTGPDLASSLARETTTDPLRLAQWGVGLAAQLTELGTQLVRSYGMS